MKKTMNQEKQIENILAQLNKIHEDSSDEKLVFVGEYIDTQYEITLYAEDHVSGKFKIKNFNEIEL